MTRGGVATDEPTRGARGEHPPRTPKSNHHAWRRAAWRPHAGRWSRCGQPALSRTNDNNNQHHRNALGCHEHASGDAGPNQSPQHGWLAVSRQPAHLARGHVLARHADRRQPGLLQQPWTALVEWDLEHCSHPPRHAGRWEPGALHKHQHGAVVVRHCQLHWPCPDGDQSRRVLTCHSGQHRGLGQRTRHRAERVAAQRWADLERRPGPGGLHRGSGRHAE